MSADEWLLSKEVRQEGQRCLHPLREEFGFIAFDRWQQSSIHSMQCAARDRRYINSSIEVASVPILSGNLLVIKALF